ncbi:hypothetical protein LCGC14_0830740 [marine sediment metagenome]|uniref:Phosphoribosyltransferase domain-containing protein n=1 Tax=marine sediment metagenome TaxID=412755 RepID=A0A0F9PKT5_9ZZZZ
MVQRRLVPNRILFSSDQIREAVGRLGSEVTPYHDHRTPLLVVGVLKGSFIFLADLVRHIRCHIEVDFIIASSYGPSTVSSGRVELRQDVRADIAGRTIILVEDIVDSGRTIARLRSHFLERGAKKVIVCALLTRGRRHEVLTGFVLESDTFVVGYGLDHHEKYRGLPEIWSSAWIEVDESGV